MTSPDSPAIGLGERAGFEGERLCLLWPTAVLITTAGFVLTFVAFRPGIMTWDSFAMWNMGVTWRFNDHHDPLIGLLLALSRLLTGDPSAYLALQLGLWWGGAYLFAVAWRAQVGRWAVLATLVGFTPFALSLMGYIHKTPLVTSCFLFAGSWLFAIAARHDRPRIAQSVALLALIYVGSVVRGYSVAAALPILTYWGWLGARAEERRSRRLRRSALLAVAFAAGFVVVDRVVVTSVLDVRRSFKVQTVYRYDLAAIYALTGRAYAGELLVEPYQDWRAARRLYDDNHGLWQIIHMYRRVDDAGELRALRGQWLWAVVDNSGAYLEHRRNAIVRSLGLRHPVWGYRTFDTESPKNTTGLRQPASFVRAAIERQQSAVHERFFMRPWFWAAANVGLSLAAALLLLTGGAGHRRDEVLPHAVLLWSGLLLMLPYLLVCFDDDARFTYWVTVATAFGGMGVVSAAVGRYRTGLEKPIGGHGSRSPGESGETSSMGAPDQGCRPAFPCRRSSLQRAALPGVSNQEVTVPNSHRSGPGPVLGSSWVRGAYRSPL